MSNVTVSFISSLLALGFVAYLIYDVLRKDVGSEKMEQISQLIQQGARAFLKREYIYVSMFVAIIAVLIAISPYLTDVEYACLHLHGAAVPAGSFRADVS